jgi:hypothetical protein
LTVSENNNETLTKKAVIQTCALLFDNGCADLFLQRVQDYWKNIDDETWLRNWQRKVSELSSVFGLRAIFCDEVHSLQSLFIGHFCHTSTPLVWDNVSYT